jgi:hypothetical protein
MNIWPANPVWVYSTEKSLVTRVRRSASARTPYELGAVTRAHVPLDDQLSGVDFQMTGLAQRHQVLALVLVKPVFEQPR